MWMVAVAAWVGVVLAGSGVTWVAIDRAGKQVTDGSSGLATQPAVVGTVGAPPTAPEPTVATTTGTPAPSASPSDGTPTPTTAATTRSATPRTSAPPVRTVIRTWSGASGSVTVACTGDRGRLRGATPVDGWVVERNDEPDDEVEVKFEKGEVEIKVKATCVGGVPKFRVETDDD